MDIGSVFVVLALLILVVFFVSQPFLDRRKAVPAALSEAQDHELSGQLAERDRVLNALQELDFDYSLGKIPEEDYPAQRARLLEYGADVLRKIDELEGRQAAPVEERLEASIAARRMDAARATNTGKVVSAAVAAPDDDLEVLLANRRRSRQDDAAGFCPKCGTALQKSDIFCPKCGRKIA